MSLKFYDFNGFKSSLSQRGTKRSINPGVERPKDSMKGSRRMRYQPKVTDKVDGLVLAQSVSPPKDLALHKQDSLKTTEERSKSEINAPKVKVPTKLRTVRPPDS